MSADRLIPSVQTTPTPIAPDRLGRAPARLLVAIAISSALHGALLVSTRNAAGVTGGTARDAMVVRARLAAAPAVVANPVLTAPPGAPERTSMPAIPAQMRPIQRADPTHAQLPPRDAGDGVDVITARAANGGAYYYAATELDERAQPINDIDPPYPPHAHGAHGYLILQLLINEMGYVDRVNIMVSDPEGVFDDAATSAFGSAKFRPAYLLGRAVKSEMLVEVKFDPGVQRFTTTDGHTVEVVPGVIRP